MLRRKDRLLCGVVEGFYGRPWTLEQRLDLFSRMSRWGMNSYLYAPKDDDKHRAYWRELYTLEEADLLSQLIREATTRGINFIYAISPGLDITFSSSKDVTLLKRKLDQVSALGCRSFAVLFDDIECDMCPADAKVFPSFAHAQVTVTNSIYSHLEQPDVFLFCPTEYCATRAVPNVSESQYLKHLGAELNPSIDVLWTGPKVISKLISASSIDELSNVLQRAPVIWDNLHANDYDQRRLFLGPYAGRSVALIPRLNGVLTNPNCEYGANYVAIHTLAQWSRCANVMSKHPSPTRQAMELEMETSPNSDSPRNGSLGKDQVSLESELLQDIHLYEPKQALETALKEWILEFKTSRLSPESYTPAKDVSLVAKAIDVEQLSSTSDESIDTQRNPLEAREDPEMDEGAIPVAEPYSLEDLHLLVDYFYLPHQHGERALHILEEFCWLKENAPGCELLRAQGRLKPSGRGREGEREDEEKKRDCEKVPGTGKDGMRSDGETSEGGDMSPSEVAQWCDRAKKFHTSCSTVSKMHARLTAIPNRPLLYDLYQYMWDAKETTMLLDSYVSWLETGGSEVNPDHEPHISRGGITAEMQDLLPQMEGPEELFSRRRAPKKPSSQIFSIRPYRPEDRDLVYQTCLETGKDGKDAADLFPNFPDLLGDRFVGPYTTLSPELSFVLEDSQGVCGYVLGTLDSRQFYDQFVKEWLPSVTSKYPKPARTKKMTPEQELLCELHEVKFFLPASLQRDFPSHLHIDLMRRAQGQGLGGRMIKTILSTLKAKGSHGVHLEMSVHNKRALKFYLKLGFTVLDFEEEEPPSDVLVLGRAL